MENTEIQYQKFLSLVEQMRMYQKDYFATKSGYSLKRAKELEIQVDNVIDEITNPSQKIKQLNLLET